MLKLKNITKTYELRKKKDKDYQKVNALKGISLEFRKSEFVSILGPSGCGKTTLLNIIGGLDKYTSGDLIINETSTKLFNDRNWDDYRNHSIGFIFQSYNLIPHQTVLQNVELALTLSGVNKEERRKKATAVLAKVGLRDKLNSHPNQLSGGQMQRVAIARALVNDPDIILADEPTGALDSKTSEQVINLLKEISKDKLIIMVTHNPELAEKYSSRIIRLLDGKVTDDTDPYEASIGESEKLLSVTNDDELSAKELKHKHKKTKMSFFTALSLSFKNLLTKKARTLLVSFAGSIGIIGIALILALSSGFQAYINKVQEDSLSSYPIVIEQNSFSIASLLIDSFTSQDEEGASNDGTAVYSADAITGLFNQVAGATKPNDLKSFYAYLQEHYSDIENSLNAIQYTYDLDFEIFNANNSKVAQTSHALYEVVLIYAVNYFEDLAKVNIEKVSDDYLVTKTDQTSADYLTTYMGASARDVIMGGGTVTLTEANIVTLIDSIVFSSMPSYSIAQFENYKLGAVTEMIDNEQLIKSQYEVVAGSWMSNDNDMLLVLDANNKIDDYVLYALGFVTYEDISSSIERLVRDEEATMTVNYNDILDTSSNYKFLLPSDYYDDETGAALYSDPISNEDMLNLLNSKGRALNICGIIRPQKNATNACLTTGLVYSKSLSTAMISTYNNSKAVEIENLNPIDTTDPTSISLYVKDFDSKTLVRNFIDKYNKNAEEGKELRYDDTIDIMMSSVSTIINAITYVLIAFVSISLVVSSIMIGIITYISVIERTKEIGVLRAIGASKKDVKRVFTAESLIIGFAAGVFGIIITLLLTIPINIIINALAGIGSVAQLPFLGAIILIAISMLLTFIAGLAPAKIASKKDPVIALRTE